MIRALAPRLGLLVAAGFAVLVAPLLAGLGGAGGWSVGFFAVIFAARYMLTTDPAQWSHPAVPAIAAGVNALVAGLLWLLGRWLSDALGWTPGWGALPPILLALAATALSVQAWSARRDATLSQLARDAEALRRDAEALDRVTRRNAGDTETLERSARALEARTDALRRDTEALAGSPDPDSDEKPRG